ncbi:hypothetical protein BC829DRAFT_433519 [Chytridium lagenaria]|nr:hypothetical protein BC829DRAFT_433519 [Chytridium lagenaria]
MAWVKRSFLDDAMEKMTRDARYKDYVDYDSGRVDAKARLLHRHMKRELEFCGVVNEVQVGLPTESCWDEIEKAEEVCAGWDRMVKEMDLTVEDVEDWVHHIAWGRKKAEGFEGREEVVDSVLEKINEMINAKAEGWSRRIKRNAITLNGKSGSGKTALMAKISSTLIRKPPSSPFWTIIRFCGTNLRSAAARDLITSISCQIVAILLSQLPNPETTARLKDLSSRLGPSSTYIQLTEAFHTTLTLIPEGINLDQLQTSNDARTQLNFLPKITTQYPNVFFVLSCIPDADDVHYGCSTRLNILEVPTILIPNLDGVSAKSIFTSILSSAHTKLTQPDLNTRITAALEKLEHHFSAARRLHHLKNLSFLEGTEPAIHYIFSRLEKFSGRVLGSFVLAYITFARNGVSEAELLDLLSTDDDVLSEQFKYWTPPFRRIPRLPVSRAIQSLGDFVVLRNGRLQFYHRQFWECAAGRLKGVEVDVRKKLAKYFCAEALFLEGGKGWSVNERRVHEGAYQLGKLLAVEPTKEIVSALVEELCTLEAVEARVKLGDGSIFEILPLLEMCRHGDAPSKSILDFKRWISEDSSFLEKYPDLVYVQALKQPLTSVVRQASIVESQITGGRPKIFMRVAPIDADFGPCIGRIDVPGKAACVKLIDSGQKILAGFDDGRVGLWDVRTCQGTVWDTNDGAIGLVTDCLDGEAFLSVTNSGVVKVWDMRQRCLDAQVLPKANTENISVKFFGSSVIIESKYYGIYLYNMVEKKDCHDCNGIVSLLGVGEAGTESISKLSRDNKIVSIKAITGTRLIATLEFVQIPHRSPRTCVWDLENASCLHVFEEVDGGFFRPEVVSRFLEKKATFQILEGRHIDQLYSMKALSMTENRSGPIFEVLVLTEWNARSGKILRTSPEIHIEISSSLVMGSTSPHMQDAFFAHIGDFIVAVIIPTVICWNAETFKCSATRIDDWSEERCDITKPLVDAFFVEDGKPVLSSRRLKKGTLQFLDATTGRLAECPVIAAPSTSSTISSGLVCGAFEDKNVRVLEIVKVLEKPRDLSRELAFSFLRVRHWFLTGHGNGEIRVYGLEGEVWEPVRLDRTLIAGHSKSTVFQMVMVPDQRHFISVSADRKGNPKTIVWEIDGWREVVKISASFLGISTSSKRMMAQEIDTEKMTSNIGLYVTASGERVWEVEGMGWTNLGDKSGLDVFATSDQWGNAMIWRYVEETESARLILRCLEIMGYMCWIWGRMILRGWTDLNAEMPPAKIAAECGRYEQMFTSNDELFVFEATETLTANKLQAWDLRTKSLLWVKDPGNLLYMSPTSGRVIVKIDNYVICFEGKTGKALWRIPDCISSVLLKNRDQMVWRPIPSTEGKERVITNAMSGMGSGDVAFELRILDLQSGIVEPHKVFSKIQFRVSEDGASLLSFDEIHKEFSSIEMIRSYK